MAFIVMLWICNDIPKFNLFRDHFKASYSGTVIDLSKLPSERLADEADAIVEHHKECAVFLGHLEVGWMLEPSHQTRIRKLIRKFRVGLVMHFVDSLPFSWKNEIEVFYTDKAQDGEASPLDNGSPVQHESKL